MPDFVTYRCPIRLNQNFVKWLSSQREGVYVQPSARSSAFWKKVFFLKTSTSVLSALLVFLWKKNACQKKTDRPYKQMVGMGRFELPTNWFVASYSIQLSYIPAKALLTTWGGLYAALFSQSRRNLKKLECSLNSEWHQQPYIMIQIGDMKKGYFAFCVWSYFFTFFVYCLQRQKWVGEQCFCCVYRRNHLCIGAVADSFNAANCFVYILMYADGTNYIVLKQTAS